MLGHSLGVIALQAGVGAHVIDVDPAEAKASLEAISQTSRSSLAEVRRILGALRTDSGVTGYHPPLGLDALDALAAELTEAGLPVTVQVRGTPQDVPPALGLTAYRVVQEALTNVLRHAGPSARADVSVRYDDRQVTIQVDDDGHPAPAPRTSPRTGHGQLGMRERVSVWGGTLQVGPRAGRRLPGDRHPALRAPGETMIRVAVVDDEALVRRGLTVLLRLEPGLDVVGEAEDGAGAIELVRREHPDVVLMDIRMPGTDGLAATRALMSDPDTMATRVIILTTFDLDEYVFGAIRAGASGFLPKDTTPEDLLTAIRVVADGDSLLAPNATRRLIAEFVRQSPVPEPTRPPGLAQLTDREIEVLRAVAHGHSNVEIADELVISYATAKSHVSSLLAKLQVRDRAQLVMLAYEHGIVTPRRTP